MIEPLDENVRRRLQNQSRRNTKPELALRSELHRKGLRFRIDRSPEPVRGMRSRADIVFGLSRVAVFVDGCFWHRCPEHGSIPRNNREWWEAKLSANVERDRRVDAQLAQAGWCVERVWEHEAVPEAAARIAEAVSARRPEN